MANERLWDSIGPIAFTANGGADGVVTLTSTQGLRVKQQVKIYSASLQPPEQKLEIKKVLSFTKAIIGPIETKGEFMSRYDLSGYLVADSATLTVIEQKKSKPRPEDIIQAIYEQEPVVAIRTHAVDELGRSYNDGNPLPIVEGGNQIGPAEFDEVVIVRDGEDFPTQYQFFLNGVQIHHIDVSYNPNKFAIRYKGFEDT
jgi:hypothetical protein